jgi:hypothetical protein
MMPGGQIAVETCRLCGHNTRNGGVADFDRDIYFFDCERCGLYHMTFEAYFNAGTMETAFLRTATRQAFEGTGAPLRLTAGNLDVLPREHENTSIPENVEKFLSYIRNKCPRPAQTVELDPERDYPIIDALNGSELRYIAEHAEDQGLVKTVGAEYSLTPTGWAHLMGPSGGGAIPGRCFVAMSFSVDPGMYADGIRPAVKECGYSPISMKDVLMNEDICYRMLAEIRKAQIVIADFTEHKHGVYFEAGFARALGREVFWTCHQDHIGNTHFDTNHYQHVIWSTPADLRVKLSEKILAVVGRGPSAES